jgi:cyclopropane-fatty-acyl-phospholipid synthase
VIAGHYDLPAQFWELILDESMAYSCGSWQSRRLGYDLADAQRDKLEQICRKLALRAGSRLLDLGCGWGSLTMHAATRHDADVTAVTLSGQQARYLRKRARAAGLDDRVRVRALDYRDIGPGSYDAIACIEMGEHVGDRQYPVFCTQLASLLRPGGRLFVQQMARGSRSPGGGQFIEAFITADMHMRPVGQTLGLLENAGFEVLQVQATRDDYTRTIRAWQSRFERRYAEAAAIIGEEAARVWRLYLAGAALAFEDGRMSVHQILATRPAT